MNGTLGRAREALGSRDFRYLFAARLTSQAADGLFQIAVLSQVVFDPEGQSTTVGFAKAAAVLAVPYSLVGPFTGVFIDRWSRRRILALAPLLRAAAALLTLAGAQRVAPYYAGALLVISLNRFFLSTAGAVMPRLVPARDLLIGNSLATVGGTFATLVGVTVGGQLAESLGDAPLIAAIGAMWLAAGILAGRIKAELRPERDPAARIRRELGRVLGETIDGMRVLARTPRALYPIGSITLDQFVQGLVLVISLVVFRDRFGQGVGSFSWLVGAGGVGIFAGLTTVGWLEQRLPKPSIVAVAFVISGLALLGVAPVIAPVTVLVASFLLGLSFAWKKIPVDTMVQQAIPDGFRGRVFAVYDLGYNMARVIAALLAIPLLPAIGVPWAIALSGAAFLLWAPVLPRRMRRTVPGAGEPVEVRFYAGGRAGEVPRSIVVDGVERQVEVQRSWREDRGGVRLLAFALRLPDGSTIRVSGPEGDEAWSVDGP